MASDGGVYRTLASPGEARLTDRGSRFDGLVRPVKSRSQADAWVESCQAEYADATHVVPAYRIRSKPRIEWADDDGEPGGSAGDPVLSALAGRSLWNVAAVVVREYGGTNLGIGGLVRAYRTVTERAIDSSDIVERVPTIRGRIEVTYDNSGTVRCILESEDVALEAAYEEAVTFDVDVPVGMVDDLDDRILSATHGQASIEWCDH